MAITARTALLPPALMAVVLASCASAPPTVYYNKVGEKPGDWDRD
jgi:hypothetical protein